MINSTERTVLSTQKVSIRLKAHNWCIAKEAADNSTAKCSAATTDLTKWDPAIDVNDAFYKYIGSITDCPAGTAQVDGKCPAATPDLDAGTGAIKTGFQNARDGYYARDVIKTH